jgi:peptidoglycan/xylan/chitin deacetylase (PgdA/CDA1 family)
MSQKKPFFISIDFEDFSHDYKRSLGIVEKNLRIKALEKSYTVLTDFAKNNLKNKKFTFFTTGIVAEKAGDLVKQIAKDGHEVSCHYFYHDLIFNQDRKILSKNINRAIEVIEKRTGMAPPGFRAPAFSIKEDCKWAYEEIFNKFKYDSSFIITKKRTDISKNICIEKKNIKKEIFIYSRPIFFNMIKMRSGGTFLKLFGLKSTLKTLEVTEDRGYIPQIYLHPYDLLYENEFWVKWNELSKLNYDKRVYKWLRQTQWHTVGNKTAMNKIIAISNLYEHQGLIKDFI